MNKQESVAIPAVVITWHVVKQLVIVFFESMIAAACWWVLVAVHYLAFPASFNMYDSNLGPYIYFILASAPIVVGLFMTHLTTSSGLPHFHTWGRLSPILIGWFIVVPGFKGTTLTPGIPGLPFGSIVWGVTDVLLWGILFFPALNWVMMFLVGHTNYKTPFRSKWWMHGAIFNRSISQDGGRSKQSTPKKGIKYIAEQPALRFADVVGMDDLKARLLAAGKSIVETSVAKPGETTGPVRNGILLHGEPGNGKTMFVEALAGELGLPFLRITFGDFASKWVNETTENVKRMFADARAQAPCLLFVDEIDALLVNRDNARSSDSESTKTVNTVLTELVNLRSKGVVMAAATNYLNQLDDASIREGRFDFKIEVPPPDQAAREAIIRSRMAKNGIRAVADAAVIKTVAARWKGFSAARVTAVVDEVATQVAGKTVLVLDDFQAALRTIQGRKGSIPEDTPTLDKMHFPDEVARKLSGLAARMSRIEEIEALGGSVPAGLLFFGPPGTGKTATARSLAKTTGWALVSVSGNELLSKPERIDQVLKDASDLRPCIVFIDEADDILAERGSNPYATTVTNKLLTAIDGAGGKVPDVVFIAATNLPDAMDTAALRGGRFTEKIEFALPDRKALSAFVEGWMRASKAKIDGSLTPGKVVDYLEGLSIANVREILQQAVNLMVERHMSGSAEAAVIEEDLERAARTVAQFQ